MRRRPLTRQHKRRLVSALNELYQEIVGYSESLSQAGRRRVLPAGQAASLNHPTRDGHRVDSTECVVAAATATCEDTQPAPVNPCDAADQDHRNRRKRRRGM